MISIENFNAWVIEHADRVSNATKKKAMPLFIDGKFNKPNWNGGDPLRDFVTSIEDFIYMNDDLDDAGLKTVSASGQNISVMKYTFSGNRSVYTFDFKRTCFGDNYKFIGAIYEIPESNSSKKRFFIHSWINKRATTRVFSELIEDTNIDLIVQKMVAGAYESDFDYPARGTRYGSETEYLQLCDGFDLELEYFD